MSYLRVIDQRLKATSENDVHYIIKEGAQNVSYVPLTSSSHSNQSTQFQLNNIADRVCRDSRLVISFVARVTMSITSANLTAPGTAIDGNGDFGLKQFPYNRCVSNIQHQINQASYSLNTNQILDAISRLNINPDNCNFYDNTQPDFADQYVDASALGQYIMNPLNPYTSTIAGDGVYKPRTVGINIVSGNSFGTGINTQPVVVDITIYEPIISPFANVGSKNSKGLYAINGEQITLTYVNDLFNNMIAFVPKAGWTLNSGSVSFTAGNPNGTAKLYCIYLTPNENIMKEIPNESIYHYNNYTVFSQTSIGACAAGTSLGAVTTPVCNFTNIPQRILIYAKLSQQYITCQTPDKYLSVDTTVGAPLSVQWDSGTPQLSAACANQLYDVSSRNGLTMPRECFLQSNLQSQLASGIYGCGSVIVLDPAMDLALRPGLTNSSPGRFIFQATINFRNNTATNFPGVDLYVVGINDAILERNGSEYRNYLVSVPDGVVDIARQLPAVDHSEYMEAMENNMFLSGGSFKSFFKKVFHGIGNAAKFLWKHKDTIADVAKKVAPMVGLGNRRMVEQQVPQFRNAPIPDMHPARNMDLFYQ